MDSASLPNRAYPASPLQTGLGLVSHSHVAATTHEPLMIVSLLFIFHVLDLVSAAAARLGSREISLTGPAEEYRLADDFSFPLGHSRVNGNESPTYTVRAIPTTVWRPRDPNAIQRARERSLRHAQSEPVEWEQVDVIGPDVEDIHTLAQLARMTGNAYALPGQKNWYDVDPSWNIVRPAYCARPRDGANALRRASRLAGKTRMTGSAATFLCRRIIPPLC